MFDLRLTTSNQTRMKKIIGIYTLIITLFSVIVKLLYNHIYLYDCRKKLILSNTCWTNLSVERTFLFSENKFCFRFFRETQDVSTVFLRKVGCLNSFSTKSRIFFIRQVGYIRAFIKRLTYYIIKTASGFFLVLL